MRTRNAILFTILFFTIAISAVFSCRDGADSQASCENGIRISEHWYLFPAQGSDSLLLEITPPSEWHAVSDVDWIEVRRLSQSRALVISGGEASSSGRFGTVVFTSGECSDTLTVERFSSSFSVGNMDYSNRPRFLLSSPIL